MPKTSSPSMSTYTTMMRVNSKGRPYAKDLYDLFSAFLIQQPLTDHRSFLRNYPSTFTTDEAVESLGQLQFTHLVSTPNPLDQSQPLLTRTTTTFSMSGDMAKTLGQHFINARLAESATDPQNRTLKDRGIWALTPKGKFMIQDFSQRARVPIQHMQKSLNRIHNFQIVMFERLIGDDQLSFSRSNMTQAFKVMMEWLPTDNIMLDEIGGVDNQSIIESYTNAFFGYQCFEWIMEYTSVVSNEEAEAIAAEFVLYGWIQQVLDKSDKGQSKKDETAVFKTGRKTQYYLTDKGRFVLNTKSIKVTPAQIPGSTLSAAAARSRTQSSTSSDSNSMTDNSNKLQNSHTKKEAHSSRLLPTTAESLLPNDESGAVVIPKVIITKKKFNPKTDDVTSVDDESVLHIENNSYDFGFSSASSTTSSSTTTVEIASSLPKDSRNTAVDVSSSPIYDQMNKLQVSVAPTHTIPDQQPGSQNSRLQTILNDPLIRLYFRRFLKSNFCEENVNFWVDYTALVKKIGIATEGEDGEDIEAEQKTIEQLPTDVCESLLIYCSTIYNTYFCPQNAPSELNIDHGLRHDIIQYMQATFQPCMKTQKNIQDDMSSAPRVDAPFGSISVSSHGILTSSVARNDDVSGGTMSVMKEGLQDNPQTCLQKIISLYDLANDHICKTMAQDSVPRFIRTEKYRNLMQTYYQQIQASDQK